MLIKLHLVAAMIVWTSMSNAYVLKGSAFKYTLGTSGDYVESDDVKARVLSFDAGMSVEDKITNELTYHVSLIGNFENGSNKATGLTAEYEPNQAINLRQGGVIYNPSNIFKFEVGALNQNYHQSPLLVWNTAFLGMSERVNFGNFYLRAQQSIPNNNILSRRIGGIDEGTPFFFMESLGFDYESINKFKFRIEASRFSYKDLSSQVALTSQDFGNSVVGSNESARFLYRFKGSNLSSSFEGYFKDGWICLMEGQYLFNELAPDGRNTGTLAEFGIGKDVLMIKGGSFRNESDSSPSFYNSRMLGHNNVMGSVVSLVGKGKDYFMRFSYVKGQLIENNVRQSNMSIFNFAIVRNYEL